MKFKTVLITDGDDAADIADIQTLAAAAGRAHYRLELPNPLGHLTKSIGQPITAEQLARAIYVFKEARRVYLPYAERIESSQFIPIDEAVAIVRAIDAALEVLERWETIHAGAADAGTI